MYNKILFLKKLVFRFLTFAKQLFGREREKIAIKIELRLCD